jgi:diaminopimelate decarboxylase
MSQDPFWWERDDLRYQDGHLTLAGTRLSSVSRSSGMIPCFAYSSTRMLANAGRLKSALAVHRIPVRMHFAVKANRFQPLLTKLLSSGEIGIDCCSPAEVLHARQSGFKESQISFTGSATSDDDLRVLARHPDVLVNCDSLSQIRRLSELSPGRRIGIRVNTGIGISYHGNPRLQYADHDKTTKFGIYQENMDEAVELASRGGLKLRGLHCHSGWGMQDSQLESLAQAFERVISLIRKCSGLHYMNIGGGLGIKLTPDDEGLNLTKWAGVVDQFFGKLVRESNIELQMEPGDYLAKDAGALLLTITAIEKKRDTTFVYVNGGHNLYCGPAQYDLPLIPAPLKRSAADGKKYTLAGNINEAIDIFARDIELPGIQVGDSLALLNAGGYGASMASNHCMRGSFAEYLLD